MTTSLNKRIIAELVSFRKALIIQESSDSTKRAVELTENEIKALDNPKLNDRNISISAEQYMQRINFLIGFQGLNLEEAAKCHWNAFKLLVPQRRSYINEMSFH